MKVGINLPSQFPFGSTVQMLEVYEQVGFDSYWAPDHILGVFHPGLWADMPLSDLAADPDAFYDPFCYGAVVGTMTDRPFGISVTDATRRGAADLARTALDVERPEPRRVHPRHRLGRGREPGAVRLSVRQAGLRARGRARATCAALLDTGRMPTAASVGWGCPSRPRAVAEPPVWVAGHGPRMLRLTGQYGDGWIPAWWMTPDEYGTNRADHRRPRSSGGSTRRPRHRCCRSCSSPRASSAAAGHVREGAARQALRSVRDGLNVGGATGSSIRSATTRRASST